MKTFSCFFFVGTGIVFFLFFSLCLGVSSSVTASPSKQNRIVTPATVYDNQPPVTEKELLNFFDLLPLFRAWARTNHEEAHPRLIHNKPDFFFSGNAAKWVRSRGWQPERFFCVMGRMAAALVIIEEGNDMQGTRPPDMPGVSEVELDLARRYFAYLLRAGSEVNPINQPDPEKSDRR